MMLEEIKNLKKEVQVLKDYSERIISNIELKEQTYYSNTKDTQKYINLSEYFDYIDGFQQIINSKDNNVILMLDDNNQIWELVKRDDLKIDDIENSSVNLNSVKDLTLNDLTNSIINIDVHKKANSMLISNEDFLMNRYDEYINELNEFISK